MFGLAGPGLGYLVLADQVVGLGAFYRLLRCCYHQVLPQC